MTNVKIVIGGSFGDEGKGLMSAYFARQMMERSGKCLTVLSNGGAQRGHTVLEGEVRHVFRHFGSGTFAGADTYFPEEFIVNPMLRSFSEEIDQELAERIREYFRAEEFILRMPAAPDSDDTTLQSMPAAPDSDDTTLQSMSAGANDEPVFYYGFPLE